MIVSQQVAASVPSASTAAVILAAGSSTRLGHPKQLVTLGGETLLERSVRTSAAAGLAPIFVVVRAGAPHLAPRRQHLPPCILIENPEAPEGMASSIRSGIAAAQAHSASGVIILACDQPSVTAEHLHALASSADQVTCSRYAGRNGVPAYFPASTFPALLHLRGDKGARDLLADAPAIHLADGDLDIDTPSELARARQKFDSHEPTSS